jgi:hypothetical protein
VRSKPETETVLPTVQPISSNATASVNKNIILNVNSEILLTVMIFEVCSTAMCDLVDGCQIFAETCCMITLLELLPEKEVISFLRRLGNYPAHYSSSHSVRQ